MAVVLSVNELLVMEVAKGINELVYEKLGFRDGQFLPFFDQLEHVLH